jgi:hypothetical protein
VAVSDGLPDSIRCAEGMHRHESGTVLAAATQDYSYTR